MGIEALIGSIWLHRLVFLSVAAGLLFLRLLPLETLPGGLPGPDLLLCLIFAWTMRRPDYLPALMIAAVVLVEDLILMRPPGLWAGLLVLATEFLRARSALTRELTFGVEWLLIAGLMLAVFLANRLVLAALLVPLPGFGFAMVQVLWSIAAYPAVVLLSRAALDLRKPAMGEVDAYGRRL